MFSLEPETSQKCLRSNFGLMRTQKNVSNQEENTQGMRGGGEERREREEERDRGRERDVGWGEMLAHSHAAVCLELRLYPTEPQRTLIYSLCVSLRLSVSPPALNTHSLSFFHPSTFFLSSSPSAFPPKVVETTVLFQGGAKRFL